MNFGAHHSNIAHATTATLLLCSVVNFPTVWLYLQYVNMKANRRYTIKEDALGKTLALQSPSHMSGKQTNPLDRQMSDLYICQNFVQIQFFWLTLMLGTKYVFSQNGISSSSQINTQQPQSNTCYWKVHINLQNSICNPVQFCECRANHPGWSINPRSIIKYYT